MIKKILNHIKTRRAQLATPKQQEAFTRGEVIQLLEETRRIAYNDGKRDGLSIAREQASKSLKEILWQQNKNQ